MMKGEGEGKVAEVHYTLLQRTLAYFLFPFGAGANRNHNYQQSHHLSPLAWSVIKVVTSA